MPHDEPWTRHAMRELGAGLEARGELALSARVLSALAACDRAIAQGFGTGA